MNESDPHFEVPNDTANPAVYTITRERIEMARRIREYTPRIPAQHWALIGDFVRAAVADAEPLTVDIQQNQLSSMTHYVLWAWKQGLELDRSTLFDVDLAEAYIATLKSSRVYRSGVTGPHAIQMVINALADDDSFGPVKNRGTHRPVEPYVASEIASFYGWASGQSTDRRRKNALAIMVLCAGAGMSTQDLLDVRVGDFEERDGCVLVTAPSDGRVIPVRALWEDSTREIIAGRDRSNFLYTADLDNRRGHIVGVFIRSTSGIGQKPSPQRLRATWIIDQLNSGTHVAAILAGAGMTSFTTLARYLHFVSYDIDSANASMRNAASAVSK